MISTITETETINPSTKGPPLKPAQLSFLKPLPKSYGGDLLKGRRKTYRPIDPRKHIHLTMRATVAKGPWSMLRPQNADRVRAIIETVARKRGVKVYQYANVGNHLHLILRTPSKKAFQAFLKEAAGMIAMTVTGARKGLGQKFWDQRAFTRIVEWGRDLKNLEIYFIKNLFEANGLLTRKMKEAGVKVIPLFGRLAGAGPP